MQNVSPAPSVNCGIPMQQGDSWMPAPDFTIGNELKTVIEARGNVLRLAALDPADQPIFVRADRINVVEKAEHEGRVGSVIRTSGLPLGRYVAASPNSIMQAIATVEDRKRREEERRFEYQDRAAQILTSVSGASRPDPTIGVNAASFTPPGVATKASDATGGEPADQSYRRDVEMALIEAKNARNNPKTMTEIVAMIRDDAKRQIQEMAASMHIKARVTGSVFIVEVEPDSF
ncbi:MAG: hypothetical protein K2X32_06900 [Phycisphaerales bacterium]|nr:hypothetical protein [Phycisphaerales bacterium]